MRFEKIRFQNYRQLKNLDLNFDVIDPDLHIFLATNGTAKTNILNAINWCLYGDEPHASLKSRNLPLLNLNVIECSKIDSVHTVQVELHIRNSDKTLAIFKRLSKFHIKVKDNNVKIPHEFATDFKVLIQKDQQVTRIIEASDAIQFVERFIPKNIREYFFFDGERLDNYFKDTTGSIIRESINKLSGIDLLRHIGTRLESIERDLSREITNDLPETNSIIDLIEEFEKKISQNRITKENLSDQSAKIKMRITEIEGLLRDIPDVEKIQNDIGQLSKLISRDKEKASTLEKEKGNVLFEYGRFFFIREHIQNAKKFIEEKKQNKELPPKVDIDVIQESINDNICKICDNPLPAECRIKFIDLISNLEFSNNIAIQLTEMFPVLRGVIEKYNAYPYLLEKRLNDINEIESDLEDKNKQLTKLKNQLESYDSPYIKSLVQERKDLDETRDTNQTRLVEISLAIKKDEGEKSILEKKLEKLASKSDFNKRKKLQLKFLTQAAGVLNRLTENMNERIRQMIEYEINTYFQKLIWKKETFDKIIIKDDFNVELIHKLGYSALGSLSAAERELLALSFTIALHKISGFDGPILIDTPVGRVSDTQRVNMGEVLLGISKIKQVVLLFTPAEFSDDIRQVLYPSTVNKKKLRLTENEYEVILEDL